MNRRGTHEEKGGGRGAGRKIGHFFANITNVLPQMKLTIINVFYKILKRKIGGDNSLFLMRRMLDIQGRFFRLVILQQLLVKLFDKKKQNLHLMKKNRFQGGARGNSFNKADSKNQANYKYG